MKKLTLILIAGEILAVYAGENIYLGEDKFNKRHSAVKEAYIRTLSKNRAYNRIGDSSYVEIDSKEEFKKALESGALDQKIDTNKVTKTYRTIDIKNVKLDEDDLKELTQNRDRILIGSEVDKRSNLVQNINIKNSKIETDKKLNIGIISKDKRVKGIENYTNIDKSYIKGGSKRSGSKLDELDNFEMDDDIGLE